MLGWKYLGAAALLVTVAPGAAQTANKQASGTTQPTMAQAEMLTAFSKMVPHFTRSDEVIDWHGRRYKIFMSVPRSPPPPQGFAVLYVTDGNGTFPIAAQQAENEAVFQDYSGVAPAIVVGIGYDTDTPFPPTRAFDLSPPDPNPPTSAATMRNEAVAGVGGADELLDMIETRVKPMVAAHARVDATRQALFGHSRGGLFVLHALFTRPQMFQTYVAASPAIWWHNRFVLSEQREFEKHVAAGKVTARLLITAGELEATPVGPVAGAPPRMVENARAMADALGKLKRRGFSAQYREFPGDDHMSVIPGAIAAAVRLSLGRPR